MSYTLEDFIKIIERLRSKDGCPWDREQTHMSLRPCMTEEAAELNGAIRIYETTGNAENMREELGDILLQVVMHSVIAKEEGLFTLEDVIEEVSGKMVHRHPHVFGNETIESANQRLNRWEELKKEEKAGKDWVPTPLREIPIELPALVRAKKLCKKTGSIYQEEHSYQASLSKMENILEELERKQPQQDSKKVEECMGELLLEVSKIAALYRLEPEQKLNDIIDQIIEKYEPQT